MRHVTAIVVPAVLAWMVVTFMVAACILWMLGNSSHLRVSGMDDVLLVVRMSALPTIVPSVLVCLFASLLLRLPSRSPWRWKPHRAGWTGAASGLLAAEAWMRLPVLLAKTLAANFSNTPWSERLMIYGIYLTGGVIFAVCHSYLSVRAKTRDGDPRIISR